MKSLGFIVNPIAGMGGTVGLKGTDGSEILEKAVLLGAKPIAPYRAGAFLSQLEELKVRVRLIVGAGRMGEEEAKNYRFHCTVVGKKKEVTTAEDTREVSMRIKDVGVDLLAFCGGDGTARDVLDAVRKSVPILGIPTGVKMHSAVFAVNPLAAASIASRFLTGELPLKEVEVLDVDEDSFREERLSAKLYGYVLSPYEPFLIQGSKLASPVSEDELKNQAAIAVYLIEEMKSDVIYILAPGTTVRTITDLLDEKKTLLGVDLLLNKKIIAKDINEKRILEEIEGRASKIIVTPIGGQGFIFGRGNQQISPEVIQKVGIENISVIATKNKLKGLKNLRVDSGNFKLDQRLKGYMRVVTDYKEEYVVKVE